MGLSAEEVRVPNTEQTTENGNVLLQWGLLEVLIHGMATSKEGVEVVVADEESNGKADGAPNAVAAANPVREAKHVLRWWTKQQSAWQCEIHPWPSPRTSALLRQRW